ncbi:outer membrane immunogenic protein [Sphingopyxis sp. YR583]|uniref:outer membrane protein n=1 Tax=Sphingopyxis sp. YR583 TaxID=1881047 RepID=UPI0008A753F9|nr:outer membrane beta-barrel protein [Sphingopyxis sp. YR583]SEH13040.1 outer membrane immunogenic protein [Sphingopyxis sp. YR583]
MKKIVSAAALAVASLSSPALAQDTGFAGGRVELLTGYDIVEGDEGLVYGVAAGYDVAVGQGVIGIEAEINDSTVREVYSDAFVAGDELRIGAGRDIYIGGRLGFAVSPRTLLYAKAGYTNAAIDVRYDDGTTVEKARPKGDGYRVGAGLEQKLGLFGTGGYGRLEYRYSNYGNVEYDGTSVGANIDRHQILVGLGVRF